MYDVVLLTSIFNEVKIAEPLGICYLAAMLRENGFSAKIIEPSIEGWSAEKTAEVVLSTPGRLIGISMHRDKNKKDVLEFLKIMHKRARDKFICIGGHGVSVGLIAEREFSTKYTRIGYDEIGRYTNAFMIGESEICFPQLVGRVLAGQDWKNVPGVAYLKEDGTFAIRPPGPKIENLDTIPFMARDVLEQHLQKYGPPLPASLSFGRGCLYRCTFCTVLCFEELQAGKKHRQRSVENVIAEIKYLHDKYGITDFNFEDDNFIIKNRSGIQKLHSLCDAIQQLDFNISFTLFCRTDAVEKGLFSHLKAAGLKGIYLGVESIYESDLEFFHKGCKLVKIREALDTLLKLGYSPEVGSPLRVMIGYITWHPLSTFPQLRASARFLRNYKMPPKLLRRSLGLYTGVPIRDQIDEMGLLDEESEDGWIFRNRQLRTLQVLVNDYFRAVNDIRDKIRTLEKAIDRYDRKDILLLGLNGIRTELDAECFNYFDELINVGEENMGGNLCEAVERFDKKKRAELSTYLEETDARRKINDVLAMLELPPNSHDIFRK